MSDLAYWQFDWTEKVFEKAAQTPHNQYLFLTKRPERLNIQTDLDNLWFGVTVTCAAERKRIEILRRNVKAKHYHVTFEPLSDGVGEVDFSGIGWTVIGTETGNCKGNKGVRDMKQRQGGFLISKIKQIGGRRFDKILQEKNIDAFNGAQGKILYVLWQGGKMTATEISKKSGLAKTTLTAMLARMQEQGLIRTEENANDRRSALVCLTEKAAALKDEYDGVTKEIEEIYYKGFSDEEVEQFESYLKRILNNLGG